MSKARATGKTNRPTVLMIRVLGYVRDGEGVYADCHGMSEHGGRARCFSAMLRRGLLAFDGDGYLTITDAGWSALRKADKKIG
jgi:hypothetical protein